MHNISLNDFLSKIHPIRYCICCIHPIRNAFSCSTFHDEMFSKNRTTSVMFSKNRTTSLMFSKNRTTSEMQSLDYIKPSLNQPQPKYIRMQENTPHLKSLHSSMKNPIFMGKTFPKNELFSPSRPKRENNSLKFINEMYIFKY